MPSGSNLSNVSLDSCCVSQAYLRTAGGGEAEQCCEHDRPNPTLYEFSMIIIHCSQCRSCFDKLSTNGYSYLRKFFPVHSEPVEGRTGMNNPQLETVLLLQCQHFLSQPAHYLGSSA